MAFARLKRSITVAVSAALVIVAGAVTAPSANAAPSIDTTRSLASLDSLSRGVVEETNRIRAARGLSKLAVAEYATQGSAKWAGFLAKNNLRSKMYHDPNLYKTTARSAASSVGENILYTSGSADAKRFLQMWMDSPGHKANIVRGQWTHIAVAWQRSPDGKYLYMVQRFATYPKKKVAKTVALKGYSTASQTVARNTTPKKNVVTVAPRAGKVQLQRLTNGKWKTVRTFTVSSSNGRATVTYPKHTKAGTYRYRVRHSGTSTHKATVSKTKTIKVVKKAQKITGYNAKKRTTVAKRVAAGKDVIAVSTKRTVALQQKKGSRWVTIKRYKPSSKTGRATVKYPVVTKKGTYQFRLKVAGTTTYKPATSKVKTVRVK
ncbi:CAP domain-containing protein [Jonesia quinghaiensis]|uniref:CAP domain-containing protein n=1 Tax=Jonesia quinghaiensis TaxID=262806 RepID=UPI00041D54EA|nr:CAP domain-containing protein [Jonesia quinghaiensis]